eukprot:1159976-Pelagomonas_calceolata.AAC.6
MTRSQCRARKGVGSRWRGGEGAADKSNLQASDNVCTQASCRHGLEKESATEMSGALSWNAIWYQILKLLLQKN